MELPPEHSVAGCAGPEQIAIPLRRLSNIPNKAHGCLPRPCPISRGKFDPRSPLDPGRGVLRAEHIFLAETSALWRAGQPCWNPMGHPKRRRTWQAPRFRHPKQTFFATKRDVRPVNKIVCAGVVRPGDIVLGGPRLAQIPPLTGCWLAGGPAGVVYLDSYRLNEYSHVWCRPLRRDQAPDLLSAQGGGKLNSVRIVAADPTATFDGCFFYKRRAGDGECLASSPT